MKWTGLLALGAISACAASAEKEPAAQASSANAEAFVEAARTAEQRGNWGAAYKGYAEADLDSPSAENKLGAALALAKIGRDADGCKNGYAVKLGDLSEAFGLLAKAGIAPANAKRAAEVEQALTDALGQTLAARAACRR
jgi:hypothetical protein